MPPGRQSHRGSSPKASSSTLGPTRASGSASRTRPSSSRSPPASLNGGDDEEEDNDAGDGSEDSSALTDEEDEDEDGVSPSSSPLKQAHLTPHRPSRARRLPARFEADVPSTVVPLRSYKAPPNQRVTVEVRTGTTKARTKGTFKDLAPIPAGGANGDGKGKWVATIVTSDSGSGEGDEEAHRAPQTPSGKGKGKGKEKSPEVETPSRRKRPTQVNGDAHPSSASRPTTPSKAKAAASAATGSRSNQTTPKSHPKPIKRPKLDGAPPTTPRRRKSAGSLGAPSPSTAAIFEPTKPFLQPTSADYYFAAHAARRRSAASKSDSWAANGRAHTEDELPALTSKEVAKLSFSFPDDPLSSANIGALALQHYRQQYASWTSLLFMGNDLMFYGLGAKEAILEDFAATKAEEGEAAVVIVRGRMGVRSEEWVESVEEALDLGSAPTSQSGIEARLRRISARLESRTEGDDEDEDQACPPRLILVLHSLDSPSFLTPRTRSHLATLAAFSRKVHLISSITHPNGTLLSRYTGREALWIDCTTLIPMLDDCLLSASGTRLGGLPRAFDLRAGGGMGGLTGMGSRDKTAASSGAAAGGAGEGQMTSAAEAAGAHSNTPLLSSTAALHVLKSVTTKARALFLRLAAELTSPAVVAASSSSSSATSLASRSIPYARLSNLAARNFIATTDPALRALLVEFTSHGLVRLAREEAPGGGAAEERVSIRMGGQAEVDEVVKGVKTLPG